MMDKIIIPPYSNSVNTSWNDAYITLSKLFMENTNKSIKLFYDIIKNVNCAAMRGWRSKTISTQQERYELLIK